MAKSMAEHKLDGTLKSYHKEKIKTENYFALQVVDGVKELQPPENISDDEIKKQYIEHSKVLLKLKLLNPMDIGSFNLMYSSLQESKEIFSKMQIARDSDLKLYAELVNTYTKLVSQFNNIARNFFVTPAVRQKMTLNELEIEQKKNESAISKLLKK